MIRKLYNQLDVGLHKIGVGKFSGVLKNNQNLKGSSNKKRCFILATGPSIKEQNLDGLENESCISVSNFFVHPLFHKIKPHYHVFAGWHPPITPEQMGEWWADATSHFKETSLNVFIHARNKNIKERFSVFSQQPVYYYLDGGDFPIDFTKAIPPVQTVVHIAIYLAMYLGFKEIYLLGCDHSWLLHYGTSQHFYKEEEHSFTRNNYSEWSEVKDIGYEFKTYADLWNIYRKIRFEAQKENCKIFNATPQSILDVFPRVNFSEVINSAS